MDRAYDDDWDADSPIAGVVDAHLNLNNSLPKSLDPDGWVAAQGALPCDTGAIVAADTGARLQETLVADDSRRPVAKAGLLGGRTALD